jgi:hypothetical protein
VRATRARVALLVVALVLSGCATAQDPWERGATVEADTRLEYGMGFSVAGAVLANIAGESVFLGFAIGALLYYLIYEVFGSGPPDPAPYSPLG